MYERERDGRREAVVTDIEALVPENHLVRKIEKVMDYEWIYERVAPYYLSLIHILTAALSPPPNPTPSAPATV